VTGDRAVADESRAGDSRGGAPRGKASRRWNYRVGTVFSPQKARLTRGGRGLGSGFALQTLWRGSEPWCEALPCLRSVETGHAAASIHCQAERYSTYLDRADPGRVPALVSVAPVRRSLNELRDKDG
jgi:hypothetical protein